MFKDSGKGEGHAYQENTQLSGDNPTNPFVPASSSVLDVIHSAFEESQGTYNAPSYRPGESSAMAASDEISPFGQAKVGENATWIAKSDDLVRRIRETGTSLRNIQINRKQNRPLFDSWNNIAKTDYGSSIDMIEISRTKEAEKQNMTNFQEEPASSEQIFFQARPGETVFAVVERTLKAYQKEKGSRKPIGIRTLLSTHLNVRQLRTLHDDFNNEVNAQFGMTLRDVLRDGQNLAADATASGSSHNKPPEQPRVKRQRRAQTSETKPRRAQTSNTEQQDVVGSSSSQLENRTGASNQRLDHTSPPASSSYSDTMYSIHDNEYSIHDNEYSIHDNEFSIMSEDASHTDFSPPEQNLSQNSYFPPSTLSDTFSDHFGILSAGTPHTEFSPFDQTISPGILCSPDASYNAFDNSFSTMSRGNAHTGFTHSSTDYTRSTSFSPDNEYQDEGGPFSSMSEVTSPTELGEFSPFSPHNTSFTSNTQYTTFDNAFMDENPSAFYIEFPTNNRDFPQIASSSFDTMSDGAHPASIPPSDQTPNTPFTMEDMLTEYREGNTPTNQGAGE